MHVLVFGAGAVGSVLGGLLAKAGHDVTLLGRAWHLDVIKQQGLTVDGFWGASHIRNLRLVTQLDAIERPSVFDWIFFCVKTTQTAAVAPQLPRFLGPTTYFCAFQNGLGNYETLIQYLPADRVALGRVIFGAELAPGHVRVTVCADHVLIGAPETRVPEARIEALVAALQASGIPAHATSQILVALWGKVLYNCALNGLSMLFEVPYGKLLDMDVGRRLMRAVIDEAYQVAAASKIALEPATAQAYQELLFTRLIPQTAAHHSSMLQDIARGRPTEIDAMNGAIVRLAACIGVATPANALITRLVHVKERFAGIVLQGTD